MDSLENVPFTELIPNRFSNSLKYVLILCRVVIISQFLNNGLTLQAPYWNLSSKIIFNLMLTKSFRQNVSDLMVKILPPLVIEKPFMCYLWFNFFFCSRKTGILLFDRNKSIIKILLNKKKFYTIEHLYHSLKVSAISDGIRWNL